MDCVAMAREEPSSPGLEAEPIMFVPPWIHINMGREAEGRVSGGT